jgi:hypothetical protein
MTRIYVGNLPFSADEAQVRQLFEQHGTVESVALINDRETGRPRGFGFVEMQRGAGASRRRRWRRWWPRSARRRWRWWRRRRTLVKRSTGA